MKVAVIVPVFNGAKVIGGCLTALSAQSLDPGEFEVVVVDDGSTDDTAAIVDASAAASRARVRLVRLPENAGPAAARNAGIAATDAPVIAFTDADCEPATRWLERALARLRADDAPAAVEGRTEPGGQTSTLTHQMRNVTGGHWMTCNMIYRREVITEAGGFDERFRLAWLEDSDLALTVKEHGGVIAWDPDVLVRHLVLDEGRRKFGIEARKRFYNPLLRRKHPDSYDEHIATVVPGLPRLHVQYMATVIGAAIAWPVGLGGASVFLLIASAFFLRRLAYAYRARDVRSVAQVAVHPFVQTYWVLRGALHFRTFSWRI